MTQRALHLAKNLTLPLDAVTQTFAIFGKRGSGKTNGATVLVEELLKAHLAVCVLDPVDAWWGLKSSFDGKQPGLPIYIFGGDHGDLPLEPTAGALMADLVAKEHLPCILSMKLWGVGERARFVTDFAKRLLQVNADPVMLVLEEADAFIPQRPAKGEEQMLGAMDRLVRWGRQSGVGCTLVTQRSAKVNKDVTTQAETLIAFRTTGPQDRVAIDDWIKFHAGEEKREEMLASLPTLPNGTAWVWSPEWLDRFDQIAFRRRETYDSAATPKVGEKRPKPKQLADVDLDRLRALMAETVERAKADDPRELRKQIADLKAQLEKGAHIMRGNVQPTPQPKVIERFVLKDGQLARAEKIVERCEALFKTGCDRLDAVRNAIDDDLAKPLNALAETAAAITAAINKTRQPTPLLPLPTTATAVPRRQVERSVARDNGSATVGNSGLRRMLIALAQRPQGLNRRQLGLRAGLSSRSGTFDTYLSRARSQGWVEGDKTIRITDAGVAALGHYDPLPEGQELLRYWLGELGNSGAARILSVLSNVYPRALTRTELGEAANLSDRSGTFDTYLSRLRGLELIEGRSELRASEELFS